MDTTLKPGDLLAHRCNYCEVSWPKFRLPPQWECWLWLALFVGVILLFQWSR